MSSSENQEEKRFTDTAGTAGRSNKTTAVTAVLQDRYPQPPAEPAKQLSNKQIDMLIDEYADLTKSGPKNMSGYYAQVIRKIGEQKFRQLASTARCDGHDGTKPQYFSWLLKRAAGPMHA